MHSIRLLVALLIAATTALLVAPPAGAETWNTEDPRDPGLHGYGDIRSTRVTAAPRTVFLRVRVEAQQAYDTIWHFDTDGDARPEFYAHRNSDSLPGTVYVGRELYGNRCSKRTVDLSERGTVLKATFPLRCLRDGTAVPTRIRVRVITAEDEFDADCAPGPRRRCGWSRWIRVG